MLFVSPFGMWCLVSDQLSSAFVAVTNMKRSAPVFIAHCARGPAKRSLASASYRKRPPTDKSQPDHHQPVGSTIQGTVAIVPLLEGLVARTDAQISSNAAPPTNRIPGTRSSKYPVF